VIRPDRAVVAFPRSLEAVQRRARRAFEGARDKVEWAGATPEAETLRRSEYPLWLVLALLGLTFVVIGVALIVALPPVAAWSLWRAAAGRG
jgi:hypothetical protein